MGRPPLDPDLKAARGAFKKDPGRAPGALPRRQRTMDAHRARVEARIGVLSRQLEAEVWRLLGFEFTERELRELKERIRTGETQLHALVSFPSGSHWGSVLVADGHEKTPIGQFETWMEIAFRREDGQ